MNAHHRRCAGDGGVLRLMVSPEVYLYKTVALRTLMELKYLNPVKIVKGKSGVRKMVTNGCLTDPSHKMAPAQFAQLFAMALVKYISPCQSP